MKCGSETTSVTPGVNIDFHSNVASCWRQYLTTDWNKQPDRENPQMMPTFQSPHVSYSFREPLVNIIVK